MSEAVLELEDQPEGSVRRKVVKSLKGGFGHLSILGAVNLVLISKHLIFRVSGKHHEITPETPSSQPIEHLMASLLSSVNSTLSKPVAFTLTAFDVRSEMVRTGESAVGNWVADILLHGYSESGERKGVKEDGSREPSADAVLICGGTLRGDSQYGPGEFRGRLPHCHC